MKKLLLPLLVVLSYASYGQLWTEDFAGETNNDVTGTAGGTVGGTWSVTDLPTGGIASFSKQSPLGQDLFRANQTGAGVPGIGEWNSGPIDISGTGMATIALNLVTLGTNATDYIEAYYSVDGGAEILFASLTGQFISFTQPGSAIVAGNSLEVIVKARENTAGNFPFLGIPNAIGFDDLSVTFVPVVYSCGSANWNVNGTWSTVGFTGPCNAPSPPTDGQAAIIGGGHTVNFTADATVGGVEVRNTGTLRYMAANLDLGIEMGLVVVRSGGNINRNGFAGTQIDFNQSLGGATLQVDAGGTITIEDLTYGVNAGSLHYLLGGGSLSIADDILIGAAGATLTNDMTTTVAVTDRIEFSANTDNTVFVNNGTITAGSVYFDDIDDSFTNNGTLTANVTFADNDNTFTNSSTGTVTAATVSYTDVNNTFTNGGIVNATNISYGATDNIFTNNGTLSATTLLFSEDDNFFTNNSSATFTANIAASGNGFDDNTVTNSSGATLSFVNLDGNSTAATGDGGDITILNSGTITQTGTFLDITNNANALNDINNLAGATWNYSGTGHDPHLRLFANNPTNLFDYQLAGAQQIITPVAGNGYNNLTLRSTSAAAKTALGSFSVSGNYTRSGLATFANGGFTVTLNGTAAQTISAVGGETFSSLTINNTLVNPPSIILNNPVTVSAVLTMTDGNVHLNGNLFTLSQQATGALVHNGTAAAGWMYGAGSGSRIVRGYRATTAIAIGNVDGLLPIGTLSHFRPFFMGKTSIANTQGTIAVNHGDPGTTDTGLNIGDPAPGTIIIRRNNSAWVVTLTPGGAGVASYTIRYGGFGMGTVTNFAHLRAMLVNSAITGTTHVLASGTAFTDVRVERSGLTAAQMTNTFYMGSTNNASPLPIELLSFTAKLNNDAVDLNWSTASEVDNDFFTIERASNVEEFEAIGVPIDGKGTSNQKSDYFTRDENPVYGRSYYRLKQTDFDGKFSYSDLQVVNYDGPRFSSLQVYPNPSKGNTLTILVTGLKEQATVPVQIFNVQGQKVFDRVLNVDTPGTLKYDAEFENPLKQGLYIVKAGETLQLTRKVIVE